MGSQEPIDFTDLSHDGRAMKIRDLTGMNVCLTMRPPLAPFRGTVQTFDGTYVHVVDSAEVRLVLLDSIRKVLIL